MNNYYNLECFDIKQKMKIRLICFFVLLICSASFNPRKHALSKDLQPLTEQMCKKIQKKSKSFNNNCEFRYTGCQNTSQIFNVVDCTFCEGQKNCSYLKYLSEVECIQKCCPFQSFFLASMSPQRLQSCIMFTQMQNQANNWIHNEFFFPFLIVLIVLLIITVVFLLVKTMIHIWTIYVNQNKRNQNANHDDTTQQNEYEIYHDWAFHN